MTEQFNFSSDEKARSSRPKVSVKKRFLKMYQNSQEYPCQSFFNKVVGWATSGKPCSP